MINSYIRLRNLLGVKFVREVTSLQIGKSLSLVAGFIASVVFARILGPVNYGIYAIVISLAGIISAFINFGVWPTTVTLISEAVGRGDRAEVRNLVIYFLKVSLLFTNVLWLAVIIWAHQIIGLVYHNPSWADYLRLAVLVNMISVPFPLLTLAYQVFRKINQISVWETLKKFVYVVMGIVLVLKGSGVAGVFYALLISEIVFAVYSLVLLTGLTRKFVLFPTPQEIFINFWKTPVKEYFKFGLQNAADKNLNNYVETLPGFMLGLLSTPEQAGFFKVASSVGTLPKVFSSNISRMLSTIFPYKEAASSGSITEYYHRVAKIGTAFTFMLIAAVGLGTAIFFKYLYGPEFLPALPALYIILSTNIFMGFAVSFGPIVRTLKKVTASIWMNILALIITVMVSYYFIPKYGALGAAFSMVGWMIVSLILIFKIEQWLKE